jgi:predicted esterase
MPAWYDIQTLSDEDRLAIECEGLDETKKLIRRIIKDEIESGTPSNRIIVGGFSQGGAVALHVAYSFAKPLAGVVAFSSYLPLNMQLKREMEESNQANKGTELLMCHGSDDPVVLEKWGRKSYDLLRDTMGITGKFIVYPGMEHSSSPQEVRDLLEFIERKLPQTEYSKTKAKL